MIARAALAFGWIMLVMTPLAAAPLPAGFQAVDVGANVEIAVPAAWNVEIVENPPSPTNDVGSRDIRITADGLRFAISALTFPGGAGDAASDVPREDPNSVSLVKNAMAAYLPDAREAAIAPKMIDNGALHGSYATLSLAPGKRGFQIFLGPTHACVTAAMLDVGNTAFSVSIGSDSCNSAQQKAALSALAGIHLYE